MKQLYALFSLLILSFTLQGCTVAGVAVGAAATTGVASFQERGLTGVVSDAQIEIAINKLWFNENREMFQNLNLKVYEGRVLITGYVPDDQQRLDGVRLAWQPEGVKEVINEINIGPSLSLEQIARDKWMAGQIEGALLLEGGVYDINYNVHAVNNVVYLIGIAQSASEEEIAISIVKQIEGVERVISYMRLKEAEVPQS